MPTERKRPKRARISSRSIERRLEWALDEGNAAGARSLWEALDASFTDRLQYLMKLYDHDELMNEIRRVVGRQDHWRSVVRCRLNHERAEYERPAFEEQVSG